MCFYWPAVDVAAADRVQEEFKAQPIGEQNFINTDQMLNLLNLLLSYIIIVINHFQILAIAVWCHQDIFPKFRNHFSLVTN